MLWRALCLASVMALGLSAQAWAGPAEDLAEVLRVDEVIAIMRDEGITRGAEIDAESLEGRGGASWRQQIDALYDVDAMAETLIGALNQGMSQDQIAATKAYFETQRGQTILSLEASARQAMADPDVEEAAKASYLALRGTDDPHLAKVTAFVTTNDLLERNLTDSLNAHFQFLRGMAAGDAIPDDERSFVVNLWGREEEIRDDTEAWLYGYLMMAYRPLDAADLRDYVAFSASPPGQAFNNALFAGFDSMYRDISYRLGLALARALASSEL